MPTKLLTESRAARFLGMKLSDFRALSAQQPPSHYTILDKKMFSEEDLTAWVQGFKVPGVNTSAAVRSKDLQPEPGGVSGLPPTALRDPVAERARLARLAIPGDQQRAIPDDMPYVRPSSPDAPNPYRGMSPRQIAGCGLPGDDQ